MKKNILYALSLMTIVGAGLTSCTTEDALSPASVVVSDKTEENDFDRWLEANYVAPYNIDFHYRYSDAEGHMNYYMVPSRIEDAIKLAHIVKYLCLETYDQMVGVQFTRQNFPKMIYPTGTWEFKNNGTYILGTAEGGKKIFLMGTHYLDDIMNGRGYGQGYTVAGGLNHYYIKTIHHEFTHILNQTKDYSPEFEQITTKTYVNDGWSEPPYNVGYLGRGFISAYAQDEDREDFAEMVSLYITNTPEKWEEWMQEAAQTANSEYDNKTGRELIEAKLDIVRAYMSEQWGIDIDQMRDEIQKRQNDVAEGKIDLTDLSVD
ncbi:MAG: putative zinc-binding metallopeptidase [Prevotella sp.]|nr:putative zinc-binding metallopeptidase [Prevotella sp.]